MSFWQNRRNTREMADDAAWDTSKENFQPLRKGREAKILTEVSAMPQGERASKIKEERRYAPAAAQISDSRNQQRRPAVLVLALDG